MLRRFRRDAVRREPFPDKWEAALTANVRADAHLTPDERAELRARIQVFIDEKYFEGIGIDITDEMRVTIAAEACLLELHRAPTYYPDCQTVFVYPSAFTSVQQEVLPGGVVAEHRTVRIGEAWRRGSVVLAWDAAQHQARGLTPGRNVTLHEFAHKLDGADGDVDGVPPFTGRSVTLRSAWAQVMSREYRELITQVHTGHASVIDPYGASSPAEFFAVVTETFFENPVALRADHPDLYALLRDFYGQDPAGRVEGVREPA